MLPGPDISSPAKLDKLIQPLYTALATCKKRVPYPVILGKPAELWVPEELLSHKARKGLRLKVFACVLEFLRASCDGSNQGFYNEPGLPELKGTFSSSQEWNSYLTLTSGNNGVFSWTTTRRKNLAPGSNTNESVHELKFTASQGNSIYGKSSTVMPSSINIPIIIYLGITS